MTLNERLQTAYDYAFRKTHDADLADAVQDIAYCDAADESITDAQFMQQVAQLTSQYAASGY
jgi:hypothetical protein